MQFSESGKEIINIHSENQILVVEKSIVKICSNSSKQIGNLKELSFEEDSELETLERGAFRNGAYTSISLSNCKKLQSLPIWCFRGCKQLSYIELPEDGRLKLIDQGAFAVCSVLSNLKIPKTVEELAPCSMVYGAVFHYCIKLFSIVFAENSVCKMIGDLSFWCCSSLVEFVVPPLVTKLSKRVFYMCTSLTRVVVLSKRIDVADTPFDKIENTIKYVYVSSIQAKYAIKSAGISSDRIVLLGKFTNCYRSGFTGSYAIITVIISTF